MSDLSVGAKPFVPAFVSAAAKEIEEDLDNMAELEEMVEFETDLRVLHEELEHEQLAKKLHAKIEENKALQEQNAVKRDRSDSAHFEKVPNKVSPTKIKPLNQPK
eukprot:TRINITY_DN782147_c0_g1_i1.p1 TRINITY_DN782147_c0_g1~~TRINITY_DN782147_c0_g1_i1.p1  ORF type:complete len:105 (-),score=40.91 TRINITY_DN782147_c0_g1_i1:139-453(-)